MTKSRSNATAEAAKGDLRAGTGTNTSGILAVGSNGYTLVADSSQTTGLGYGFPFTQPVINGGMDIWQRGTSISLAASAGAVYSADRWCVQNGANQAMTISRQATSDTTNLPNIQYCLRYQRNSGQTGTGTLYLQQSIETINAIPYAGKTITVSFYARAGANFSASGSTLSLELKTGTGTDQNGLGTWTGGAYPITGNNTLTTTWQRFTATGTLATNETEIALTFYYVPTGTASTNDYFEITGVQIDLGSTALPFRRSGGTIQGELAACQRYYYRTTVDVTNRVMGWGFVDSSTTAPIIVTYPVTMRVRPTALEQTGTASDYQIVRGGGAHNCTAVPTFDGITTDRIGAVVCTVASGLTQGQAIQVRSNASTSYFGWSAEL